MPKYFLLSVLFLAVLLFIPVAKTTATQVYVGVQISIAQAPGYPSGAQDSNWCLPGGYDQGNNTRAGTEMAITTTGVCSYKDVNYPPYFPCNYCSNFCIAPTESPSDSIVYTTSPTCVGGTVWSGLLDLTNNSNYNVYLYTPSFCPGYIASSSTCWVSDTVNENCCDVCAHYGTTPAGGESNCESSNSCYSNYSYDDSNCSIEAGLMGSVCSSCTTGASYSYYSPTTHACFTTFNTYNYYTSCSATITGYSRVCYCNSTNTVTGFNLPFTASF